MNFYDVFKLSNKMIVEPVGIDVVKMSETFKLLDKKAGKKNLDEVMDYSFIFVSGDVNFSNEENLDVHLKHKKINVGLVKENKIFQLVEHGKIEYKYYAAIHEGKLKTFANKKDLELELEQKSVTTENELEKKALDWINNGRVGLSSATMCVTFFPELKNHHRFNNMKNYDGEFEINWPHDNSDFMRCVGFLEAVPDLRKELGKMSSVSKEWANLVGSWNEIESLIKKEEQKDSYDLIKKCINKEVKKLKM